MFFLLLVPQLSWSQIEKKVSDLFAFDIGKINSEITAKNEKIALKKEEESLLKSCREKSTVTFNIRPYAGPCMEMACGDLCCNACSSEGWKILDTVIPEKGKMLPLCKPDGCGNFSSLSCKMVSASGILQNCDSYYSLSFEVQVIN